MPELKISPETTRIAWIGTGVMGSSMCGHLLKAGYKATVYNRTKSKADSLLNMGAAWADSPKQAAAEADVIFSIVGYPRDVREVILGADGALAGCKPGAVIVDMTTSEPALAVEIAEAAAKKGVHAIDAPVTGGDVGAREAKLSILIGGDAGAIEALTPLWKLMGASYVRQGGPGAGQHAKLANQILIAGCMVGVCEGLLYAYKAGLNLEDVLKSVSCGSAGSWSLSNLAPRMIAGNFNPGFFVDHFVKDMGIALDEARRMKLATPGLALAHQLYLSLQAHGGGKNGTQALVLALADLSQIDWKNRK